MWLRGIILLALVLLLSTTLSACWPLPDPPPTPSTQGPTKAQLSCLFDIGKGFAQIIIAGLSKDDERPVEEDTSSSLAADCTQAVIDGLNQQGNSNSLQITVPPIVPTVAITVPPIVLTVASTPIPPQVQVNQLSDSTFSYIYDSQTFSNCNGTQVEETFSYGMPLVLVVGQLDNNNNLQSPTTYIEPVAALTGGNGNGYTLLPPKVGNFATNNDIIAQAVYNQYTLSNYFNHSDSFPLTLPANSKVTLHLPLTIDYRAGSGQVERYGQAMQEMGWRYNYDFQRAFDPNNLTPQEMTVTSC